MSDAALSAPGQVTDGLRAPAASAAVLPYVEVKGHAPLIQSQRLFGTCRVPGRRNASHRLARAGD
ncbi:hypothetical protein [Streptomyces sp. NBC_00268]|uniref:hypothetical protein n=1 Tax=Streptomyces sp. NBC_00268 TaxID=2975695 RepID=UPI00225A4B23|nr:hypothetical protein [Streptomyces sp. NBC_00268]MCX5191249.1 hypothetical protein [Streptomyces sp. NBC_00268]